MRRRRDGLAVVARLGALCLALLALGAPPAAASAGQERLVMDDPRLVYGSDEQVESALRALRELGVDRIRVSVFWRLVAPSPGTRERPDFDAADPASYPAGSWAPYDRLVRGARRHGLDLLFTLTGPPPLWATGIQQRPGIEGTFLPDPLEFQRFVSAAGTRYSGSYAEQRPGRPLEESPEPLPRVGAWSIWNEPNHSGWLTPQWLSVSRRPFAAAPHHYRKLVDAAWNGLGASGHGGDTILLGETAPRGWRGTKAISSVRPLHFIRELYCLDARRRPYTGGAAAARGCPQTPAERSGFVEAHPALFRAGGWAHHAYGFTARPSEATGAHEDDAQLADLARLTATLDRALARYGQARALPIHITEYGYETAPPDRRAGIPPGRQASYLNEATFLAYRNPRVAAMGQFLLYDDLPWARYPPGHRRHWSTFQSGLLYADGTPKPSFEAYRLPVHVTPARRARGRRFRVFGQLPGAGGRPASARVEFIPRGAAASRAAPVATVAATGPRGFVEVSVPARRSGSYRLVWTDPASGREMATRPVGVRVSSRSRSGRRG